MSKGIWMVGSAGCPFKIDGLHTVGIIFGKLKKFLAIHGQIK